MRDIQTVEAELVEISAIQDDSTKLERIIAWCATHPHDVPFAMRSLMGQPEKTPGPASGETQE